MVTPWELMMPVSCWIVPNLSNPLNVVEFVFVLGFCLFPCFVSPGSNAEEIQTETEKGFRNER